MLGVIADDFSGAAEVAGVAWRYGLPAHVWLTPEQPATEGMVVMDTDSRSLPPEAAAARVRVVAQYFSSHSLFKKVDSVLRGPVYAEIAATLEATGATRAIVIPANPHLGRVIRDGQYLIHGQPLDATDFARDPEYPARTADVRLLLGGDGRYPVHVCRADDDLPGEGIIIGEAESEDDLQRWCARGDARTQFAGAAGLFVTWLAQQGYDVQRASASAYPAQLIISGSASAPCQAAIAAFALNGAHVARMPEALLRETTKVEAAIDRWTSESLAALAAGQQTVIAVDQPPVHDAGVAARIAQAQADTVARVLAACPVTSVWVEGGATASTLLRRLGWETAEVIAEHTPGVVTLQTLETSYHMTVKPGSYAWPSLEARPDMSGCSRA